MTYDLNFPFNPRQIYSFYEEIPGYFFKDCVCMFLAKFILDLYVDQLDSRSFSPTVPYCSLEHYNCLWNLELVKMHVFKMGLLTF